ncbi:MAG: C-GCAxxG-C-C family protein [Chloroflexi bacterium]|nr:C-GCAxxG-C-C family protein [Chloroflexota bacterium]
MRVLNRAFDHAAEFEEHAATPLAGGIAGNGYQCGMIWGAALAAGARAYRLLGTGRQAETAAVMAAQKLVASFHALNNATNCYDITGLHKSASARQMAGYFLMKGGAVRCFRMAGRYAQIAFAETQTTLSVIRVEAPPAPVSCAALLAKKMGAYDMHAVMAAGLAGGIGLSGGACGALGAAIWILETNSLKNGGKVKYRSPNALEAIDRLARCTKNGLVCAKIVGRKFEGIGDHAEYLGEGGCSGVIEALAAT